MSDSQVNIGPKPLGAVEQGEEDNTQEFLGYLVFSTTGDALVPREWLQERWDAVGLPDYLFPKEVSRWSAYRRTMRRLLDDPEQRVYEAYSDEYNQSFTNQFELEKSADMGSNVFILYAKTFYPEELIGEEGGDWRRQRIGYFNFYRGEDDDMPGQLVFNTDMDPKGVHYEQAKELRTYASDLFQKMQTHHNQSDLQKIIDLMRNRTNSVPIRRAVHFVGSHHSDVVEGLSEVWEGINQFKEDGEPVRIETTPVVNLESQREMIADRVQEQVRDMVDDIVGETMEQFAEDAETTAEETAREILNQLEESQDISTTYNQLLSMKLSVKDILKEQQEEFGEEQEEIIEKVLNQTELEDY
jgi:histone H3/H4